MIKKLVHNPIFVIKSQTATKEDFQFVQDLPETLLVHNERCAGMASNMIGVRKYKSFHFSKIVDKLLITHLYLTIKLQSAGIYETEEGCLSHIGDTRKCK